ncbi:MAG TPA: family 78 glycoside hydrolase catalytic domain [Candidatus Paceibacterota bacterium]|nr:family 78 glycoside hydrolase catalytic domain [Candidatus Paceibacterota bacterium]HRZ54126.1 family 78 glycoside hydrolase catalytic domain [Candidatus Paceibacterota bacterium]
MKLYRVLSPLLCSLLSSLTVLASLDPIDLRCEFLRDPIGIDAPQPRLSWILAPGEPPARGAAQIAYQIRAASTRSALDAEKPDLWDTGRVDSEQSIHVAYAGQALRSTQECVWQVRVWDHEERPSDWSKPARWTMGLLAPGDWQAKWIGKDEPGRESALSGVDWIWHPEGNAAQSAPVGTRYFRRAFELPADRAVKSAELALTGDNEFACTVNGRHAGGGSNFKAATLMNLARILRPGPNLIAVWVRNVGEGPNPAGLIGLLRVEFQTGPPLVIRTDSNWKSWDREVEGWTLPDFNDTAWQSARRLGPAGIEPWGALAGPEDRRLPARMLRREFALGTPVRRATASISGLGLSELYINGRKVGDHVLSPGLTDYTKRVFYVTHDVTTLLKPGPNAVGVWLGNGRFYAPRSNAPAGMIGYGYPKLLLQILVEHEDGTTTTIPSDESWKLTTDGPITENNEYDGEVYDARKELPGWASPGFDDAGWLPAQPVHAPEGTLVSQMIEPIRVVETLEPQSLTQIKPGVWIYDLGQNLVGWCRLTVSGPSGAAVTLRHAETLKPDGALELENLRGARVTDTYVLKGGGVEVYEPRFTYHGFRYVELTGHPGQPDLSTLTGCVVHDDVESAGDWSSSNPMLDRLYRNVRWGVRGNYRGISTDCPQRDERQGWLGDRSQGSRGETFLFNIAALYAKWVQDFADAQRDDGSVSDVCPAYWPIYSDNVTWPASTVIIPGHLLDQYGDARLLERHYPSMRKWVDHMAGFIRDDLMPRDTYGDWCVPPEDPKLIHTRDPARKTAPELLGTTHYIHCLRLMERYAKRLGKTDDAARFAEQAGRMTDALNRKHLRPAEGWYDNGSQTACVLPLAFHLTPPERRADVAARLVDKIVNECNGHVGTGLVGGQWLMRTLTEIGQGGLAYTLATNTTYPSWGYMADKGATTVWELWNGDTGDPAMNSGNHVMLVGDLIVWFYENLAGIRSDPAQPAFKHILMKPLPVGDLRHVRATHRSPYGWIRSEWHRHDPGQPAERFVWDVTIPPNTTATAFLPCSNPATVRESGNPLAAARGVSLIGLQGDSTVVKLGSGSYRLEH